MVRELDLAVIVWPLSGLAVSENNVLVGCQFVQAARAARMEPIGADANFRTEPKFTTVVEPSAGVYHHRRTVDTLSKFSCRR